MIDRESGAHIGGHPDARRIWARKDDGRWVQRTYGTGARIAFNSRCYVEEYEAWKAVGSPRRIKDFMSDAAPYVKQQRSWRDLKAIIGKIGKKIPSITAGDVALEQQSPRTMPDP